MRLAIQNLLLEVCDNVAQDYPDIYGTYPCLIWNANQVGKGSHDSISYFDQSLRVEIFSETSEERSQLEIQLINKLYSHGWINRSNHDLPSPDFYRQNLTFERND